MAKIAIMGYGTLGSSLAEIAHNNKDIIAARLGEEVEVKYILDVRDFPDSPFADRMIKDFSIIENDPEVEAVVECIGGVTIAREFIRRCLQAGKHVATANKHLVSTYGRELLEIAREKNVNFLFEASVGGAIPVLRPMIQCLAGNRFEEIVGILNGTTNYILTRMVQDGAAFEDVLKEAQAKGYAEADPTADVEGVDAGRKICILADLAWGREVHPDNIRMEGISDLKLKDVDIAASAGYRVKLLGRALRLEDSKVCAYVAPHLVPESMPIARVDDVFNAILVRCNAADEIMFYGRGAGKPTSSALIGDVIDALQHRERRREIGWGESAGLLPSNQLPMKWYLRGGFTADAARAACGEVREIGEGAVITAPMAEKDAMLAAGKLGAAAVLRVL